jgi:hypothetical protein
MINNQIKDRHMPALNLNQLHYEAETWKRSLDFMTDENILLKNRLSEILKENFDANLLEELENFQNSFIGEDEIISSLQYEISEIDLSLARVIFENRNKIKKADKRIKSMRNDIRIAVERFAKLKSDFNNYLSEKI